MGLGGGVSEAAEQTELEALRAEVAALRKSVAELTLRNTDAILILAELLARTDRHPGLRHWLRGQGERGLAALSLEDMRQRVDTAIDDVIVLTDDLLDRR